MYAVKNFEYRALDKIVFMADLWAKKKKILTRKERFKITDDLNKFKEESVEKLQSEKEEFYQQLQAEEKQQQVLAQQEYEKHISSLRKICKRFHESHKITHSSEVSSRNSFVQTRYPRLDNLNRIVPGIHEILTEWEDRNRDGKRYPAKSAIEDCIGILHVLSLYLENPVDVSHLENWYECQRRVRKQLYENVNVVSYEVLINIEKEMSSINADIFYHKHKNDNYHHSIWTVLDRIRNTKDEKFPLHCHFEDCGLVVHLPKKFAHKAFAVRCFIMFSDYFSSDCKTIPESKLPGVWSFSLLEHVQREWEKKRQISVKLEQEMAVVKAEQEKQDIIMNKIKYLIPNTGKEGVSQENEPISTSFPDETADNTLTDPTYLTKVTEMKKFYAKKSFEEEMQEIENIQAHYTIKTEKYECNMRKYHIVGGVYHLNVVKQPPQPKMLKDGAVLRLIVGEDCLQMWPYSETYEPPTTQSGLVKQSTDDDEEDIENTPEGAAISKLILIVLKLPDHVLWFDAPVPVHWDYEKAYWSTEYIYETKFNEEKQTLSFRAGKMTVFGLAVFKFNNLPFQSWELKRSGGADPEVTFTLTTAILALEFVIRAEEVTLTMLENANTTALQELVGVRYKPQTLLKLLRTGGVNIFPSTDAFQYIDGVQVKHHVTENHLYRCMALLCSSYRFSWSRWNLMCGYKRFVLQLRDAEIEKGPNDLLLVTDQRASITESTDVSQAFSELENADATGVFQPDLWSLAVDRDGERIHAIVDTLDTTFIETVYFMLSQTRIMSYS